MYITKFIKYLENQQNLNVHISALSVLLQAILVMHLWIQNIYSIQFSIQVRNKGVSTKNFCLTLQILAAQRWGVRVNPKKKKICDKNPFSTSFSNYCWNLQGIVFLLLSSFFLLLPDQKYCWKVQQQVWDILQGASSLGVKFTRNILAWYDK